MSFKVLKKGNNDDFILPGYDAVQFCGTEVLIFGKSFRSPSSEDAKKRPKPTMDYAEDGYRQPLLKLRKFIPVYMVDMAEDVNLFWGCSRTRCCGGYLEL